MIPILIILYIKRHHQRVKDRCRSLLQSRSAITKLVVLLMACLALSKIAFTQTKNYHFEVKKNGSSIGEIIVNHTLSGALNSVSLVSTIKYRFLFLFTAKSKEEVVFSNGIMTYSYLYREQNGDRTISSETKKSGASYTVLKDDSKETVLNIPAIYYQTLCLYTTEPGQCTHVYIDKFQKLVAIQKKAEHEYKVVFPDGSYNEYLYEGGICRRITVHQTFFTAQIELKKIL